MERLTENNFKQQEFWRDISAKFFLEIAIGNLPNISFNDSNKILEWFEKNILDNVIDCEQK